MIEQQTINGKEVWIKVNPYHVERENPNIIPTEYFTATYYLQRPTTEAVTGELIKDEDGKEMLFESPVEALSYVEKLLEQKA